MEDGRELNGHVAYIRGGGLPHGRVLIADGAVRKSEVVAAAKGRKSRPSGSYSYRHLSEENQLLQRANDGLAQQNEHLTQRLEVDHQLILMLFAELGKEPPAELLQRRKLVEPQLQGTSGSSHAASKSIQPEGTPTSTHDDINPAVGVDNSGNDFEADSGSNNGDSDPDSEDLYADSDIDLGSRGCAPGGAGGGASAEASGGASAEASSGARGGAHGGARGGARGGASHDP